MTWEHEHEHEHELEHEHEREREHEYAKLLVVGTRAECPPLPPPYTPSPTFYPLFGGPSADLFF